MALGGAIGVGLFLGSSVTIGLAGPGVILSYVLGAGIALIMAYAVTEMAVVHPDAGAFGVTQRSISIPGPVFLFVRPMESHRSSPLALRSLPLASIFHFGCRTFPNGFGWCSSPSLWLRSMQCR
jgi:hypothetical protein